MYVKRPLIMKYPVTVQEKNGLKPSIDAFIDLLINSGKESFKADHDFGFSFEDYRFEIYNPEVALFHNSQRNQKKDLIGSIENPIDQYKIAGSSVNTDTFARDLQKTIVQYEQRLKNVEVNMELVNRGAVLIVSVNGIIDDGYDTPYRYLSKIRIW